MNNRGWLARRRSALRVSIAAAMALAPLASAHAYVGPGLGLGTLIVILGFIGSLFLAVFGVVWYPIKRALRKRRSQPDDEASESPGDGAEPDPPPP